MFLLILLYVLDCYYILIFFTSSFSPTVEKSPRYPLALHKKYAFMPGYVKQADMSGYMDEMRSRRRKNSANL
jgi:hypothetical protein